MIKEIDFSNIKELFEYLVVKNERKKGNLLVGIDGASGSGKTNLSYKIAGEMAFLVLNLDDFLSPQLNVYFKAFNFGILRSRVSNILNKEEGIVIEGCCLLKVLSFLSLEMDVLIYCKEISEGTRIWNYGNYFDSDLPSSREGISALEKEVVEYHDKFKPWEKADIFFNLFNQSKI